MRSVAFVGVGCVLVVACGNGAPSQVGPDGGGLPPGSTVLPDGGVLLPDGAVISPPPPPNGKSPVVAGCDIYPPDNAWNRDVSADPLRPDSAALIAQMAPGTAMHADWGTFAQNYGIPITTGPAAPPVKMTWTTKWGPSESDKIPCADMSSPFCYPIPTTAKIEGGAGAAMGSDRHVLFLDTTGAPSGCTLYELYNAQNYAGPDWRAANGAVFKLGSNALRPDGWTSADAAGLPVLPGLVRYDEIASGELRHAVRFTLNATRQAYIHPATHAAGAMDASLPPMGLRVRLKASVNVAGASKEAQVLITALKKYGMLLADNGSDWYVQGDTNDGWSAIQDGIQGAMSKLHGSDFEVVDSGPISTAGL
jgi:hypothetical protein